MTISYTFNKKMTLNIHTISRIRITYFSINIHSARYIQFIIKQLKMLLKINLHKFLNSAINFSVKISLSKFII